MTQMRKSLPGEPQPMPLREPGPMDVYIRRSVTVFVVICLFLLMITTAAMTFAAVTAWPRYAFATVPAGVLVFALLFSGLMTFVDWSIDGRWRR